MRVLLVDPIADLLPSLQATLLSMHGMELYCAPDGATAIQHAGLLGGIDALITEVFLPGIDGFSVRDELQIQTPSLLTVFLTRHDLRAYAEALRGTPVLPIPVDPELVLSALQASRPAKSKEASPQGQFATPAPTAAYHAPQVSDSAPIFSPPQRTQKTTPPGPTSFPATRTVEELYSEPPPAAPQPEKNITPTLKQTGAALYPGAVLGPYHLFGEDGIHPLGQKFAAVHTTLSRQVHLMVMSPEKAEDIDLTSSFLADARAKAQIEHPAILTVYEAGEIEGRIFYAIERADGESLGNMLLRSMSMDVDSVLKTAQTVADCFSYLREAGISSPPLGLNDILLHLDGTVRIQNVARAGVHPLTSERQDVELLGTCLLRVLPPEAPSWLRFSLERASGDHPDCITTWKKLVACLTPPNNIFPSSESSRHGQLHSTRESQSSKGLILGGILAAGVALAATASFFHWIAPESLTPKQAFIPKDQYPVGNGRRVSLESFSIDSTEITNRQYFKFIDWMRTHPRESSRYDHPEQPPHHSHIPKGWEEMFPEKYRPEKNKADPRLDLPVTQVSWWDAYAFAQWAGRLLPTDEQWEAAGRGPRGLLFPWGDEPAPERTNVARPEYVLKPGETNEPRSVDAVNDPSVFGVRGLSGNVSEWTATRRDGKAVVKGSHFNAPLLTLDAASVISPDSRSVNLGFRTASPPAPNNP